VCNAQGFFYEKRYIKEKIRFTMPNKFKYNKTGSEPNSIFKGNWAIDTTPNNIGDGPSSVTGFYNGAEIPAGGYTIYSPNGVFVAANDTELVGKANGLGANIGSASAALAWFAGQAIHVVLNKSIDNILTDGLVLNLDASNISSFVNSEPTTNLIPNPTINAYPTTGNSWGTYNTNQYCGNNGCNVYWDIPAIASVSDNIVTTVSAHPIRSFDVINPQTTGGGVNAGQQYFAKKISDTQFSLHAYNSSQDGSQGYLNPTTGRFKVHDSFYLDQRVAVNASSFPTKWFGNPHQPNSAIVKEIITGGFNVPGHPVTDCVRLHWFRADATDGMSYNVDASVTIGVPVTTSFWVRAASPSAVGQYIAFQHYNYGGIAGASGFFMNAFTGAQGVWVRCSFTFTPTHNALISYWFPNTGDMKIDVANIQIEQNTGLTPFVAGSRSQNNTMYDLSVNANHFTLTNGPVFNANGSITFDGVDDYGSNSNSSLNITGNVTINAWIRHNGTGSSVGNYMSKAQNNGYRMRRNGGSGSPLWIYSNGNSVSGGVINDNTWYMVTGVFSSTGLRAYINGSLVASNASAYSPASLTLDSMYIGAYTVGNELFGGDISIAQVYSSALTGPQILQNFNAQKTRFGL
jgi:hypothetical protein